MKNLYEIRENYVVIFLRHRKLGKFEAIIDICDLEKVKAFPNHWYALHCKASNTFYVYGTTENKVITLHRYLLNPPGNLCVDHINHNPLDNRRKNLRILTHADNHQNRKGASAHSNTGIRGVWWEKDRGKYRVQIRIKGKRIRRSAQTLHEAEKIAREMRKMYMPYSFN